MGHSLLKKFGIKSYEKLPLDAICIYSKKMQQKIARRVIPAAPYYHKNNR